MDQKQLWLQFAYMLHQTSVSNLAVRILQASPDGLSLLQQLGVLNRTEYTPEELDECLLPWYRTKIRSCWALFPGAEAYTVLSWRNSYEEDARIPHAEDIKGYLAARKLGKIGKSDQRPSLVIHDPSLMCKVIVDGSRRACASGILQENIQIIEYKSSVGHVLFAADFFPQILQRFGHKDHKLDEDIWAD